MRESQKAAPRTSHRLLRCQVVFTNICYYYTLYTSRKPLWHLLATGVPSCEEPGSAHEQTCKISREELPHPIKLRRDELRKINFFVYLPLRCRLLISVDSCAEWGWQDILGTMQGDYYCHYCYCHYCHYYYCHNLSFWVLLPFDCKVLSQFYFFFIFVKIFFLVLSLFGFLSLVTICHYCHYCHNCYYCH